MPVDVVLGDGFDVIITDGPIDVISGGGFDVVIGDGGVMGPPGPSSGLTLARVAVGILSGQRVVIATSGTGVTYPDLSLQAEGELVLGVTTGAAQDGADLQVQVIGEMVEPSWAWAPGPVFAAADGHLTQTPALDAAWLRQVGVAVAPDRLLIQLRAPVIL